MQFSRGDEMLASADIKGLVKLWNLESGKLLRRVQAEAVSSLCWGVDPSHLLLAHHDVRLYGIRGCTVLKEYGVSAGTDFVHSLFASEDRVMAVTNSGLLKIFSYATQEELVSTNLRAPVVAVSPIYQSRGSANIDRLLIATPKRIVELSRGGEE
jgi:WD40 repeat protein